MHINSRLALSAIGKQKDVWWNSWCSSTWKDFQRRQQSTLDQQLTSTEQSQTDKSNIHCWWSRTFCAHVLGTSFSLNLTLVCNTIRLSLTTKWLMPRCLYFRKREHWCHTLHGLTLQCHRTVHVHWLPKLLLYMSQSHAHIIFIPEMVQNTHQRLRLPVRHVCHPRRKAGCLLLLRLTMS